MTDELFEEPMTATEIKIREFVMPMFAGINNALNDIERRLDLCEKVFIKMMQHDVRLDTLEFNSNVPVNPSALERLTDLQYRLERLESHLLNGDKT